MADGLFTATARPHAGPHDEGKEHSVEEVDAFLAKFDSLRRASDKWGAVKGAPRRARSTGRRRGSVVAGVSLMAAAPAGGPESPTVQRALQAVDENLERRQKALLEEEAAAPADGEPTADEDEFAFLERFLREHGQGGDAAAQEEPARAAKRGPSQFDRVKFAKMQEEVRRLIEAGLVVAESDGAGESVPLWQQGNIEMYTLRALEKRDKMRHAPQVRRLIEALFGFAQTLGGGVAESPAPRGERNEPGRNAAIAAKQSDKRKLARLDFVELTVRLRKHLLPEFDLDEAVATALEEWENDAHGASYLSYGAFYDSIFELVDLWTPDTKLASYTGFLERIFALVCVPIPGSAQARAPANLQWRSEPDIEERMEELRRRESAHSAASSEKPAWRSPGVVQRIPTAPQDTDAASVATHLGSRKINASVLRKWSIAEGFLHAPGVTDGSESADADNDAFFRQLHPGLVAATMGRDALAARKSTPGNVPLVEKRRMSITDTKPIEKRRAKVRTISDDDDDARLKAFLAKKDSEKASRGRARGRGGALLGSLAPAAAARIVEVEYVPMGYGDKTAERTRGESDKWMANGAFDIVAEHGARVLLRTAARHSQGVPDKMHPSPPRTPRHSAASDGAVSAPQASDVLLTYLSEHVSHLSNAPAIPRVVRTSTDGGTADGTSEDVARERRLEQRRRPFSSVRHQGFSRSCGPRWANKDKAARIEGEYFDELEAPHADAIAALSTVEDAEEDPNACVFIHARAQPGEYNEDEEAFIPPTVWQRDTSSSGGPRPPRMPTLRATRAHDTVVRPTKEVEAAAAVLLASGSLPMDLPQASRPHTESREATTPRDETMLVLPPRYRTMLAHARDSNVGLLGLQMHYAPEEGTVYERALAGASVRGLPGATAELPPSEAKNPRRMNNPELDLIHHGLIAKAPPRPDRIERRVKVWTDAYAGMEMGAAIATYADAINGAEVLRAPGTAPVHRPHTPANSRANSRERASKRGGRALSSSYGGRAAEAAAKAQKAYAEAAAQRPKTSDATLAAAEDILRRHRIRATAAAARNELASAHPSEVATEMVSHAKSFTLGSSGLRAVVKARRKLAPSVLFDAVSIDRFAVHVQNGTLADPEAKSEWSVREDYALNDDEIAQRAMHPRFRRPTAVPPGGRMPMRRDVSPAVRRFYNAAGGGGAMHASAPPYDFATSSRMALTPREGSRRHAPLGASGSGALSAR